MSQETSSKKLSMKKINKHIAYIYIFMAVLIGVYAYLKNDLYFILSAVLLVIALIRIYLSKN